ncbi:uncharacterized protein AC631_01853 [Debaryomyces fabryi]|uniref:Uncharacterized protein n=1 Tax=Debaryomyces fabryi TaxID=58627 RepID=A0A0V1Q2B2_9ASCO|nr:uncharacterized protein AC631_01853 [Debaryomyces fabryi]KSA02389.1 hypothetical protein AC631_01853 [Debaryomyces fabryi]CUM56532.1 unnamed protein product [Debaryomyces fabryi]
MGKLTFKGDKPKKRKRTEKEDRHEPVKKTRGENVNLDGWSTASCVEDLKGPCIVLGDIHKDGNVDKDKEDSFAAEEQHAVLQVDEDAVTTGKDLDVVADTVNFFGGNVYPGIHKCEPNKVNQVLTLVPISEFEKSRLDTSKTNRFALKTHHNRYISTTMELVHAIGDNEIFTFKSVNVANDKLGYDEPWWEIVHDDARLVIEHSDSTYKVKFVDTGKIPETNDIIDRFVIRVQSKNTLKGSQILLNDSEVDNGPNLNKIVRQLYKDTNGKIEINDKLVKRLKDAISTGDINEQIIQEKSRYLSKW